MGVAEKDGSIVNYEDGIDVKALEEYKIVSVCVWGGVPWKNTRLCVQLCQHMYICTLHAAHNLMYTI